jgi:hypothetical protein
MITMKKTITFWAVPVVALIALAGCDSGLTGVNEDPNNPTSVDATYLLPNAITGAVGSTLGTNLHMDLTALWVQHYAEDQYSTEDRYDLADSKVSGIWSDFYAGPLEDLHQIIEQGQTANKPNVAAVGLILRSWTFSILTDLWGDIGFSEASQGTDEGGALTPKYDAQSEVYDSLLADLTVAPTLMNTTTPVITSGDLLYGGDLDKWTRFANSLRMRLAMRLSNADPAKAQQEFAAAYAAGGFTSNDDNAQLIYAGDGTWDYPIFDYQKSRDDHAISATMVDTLKSLSDPRLALYANENSDGNYAGMPNGYDDSHAIRLDTISRLGTYFASATTPAVLMSYGELLFLEAEAAERGWISGNAADLYDQAITASMQQLGIDQGAIDAYLAQPRVAYAGGADGLRQIALQKWIALFGNGPEAYAEWRRTGVPNLVAGPDAYNDGRIPVRLPYPTIEQALNGANLAEAISRQGGDDMNQPVWWDK